MSFIEFAKSIQKPKNSFTILPHFLSEINYFYQLLPSIFQNWITPQIHRTSINRMKKEEEDKGFFRGTFLMIPCAFSFANSLVEVCPEPFPLPARQSLNSSCWFWLIHNHFLITNTLLSCSSSDPASNITAAVTSFKIHQSVTCLSNSPKWLLLLVIIIYTHYFETTNYKLEFIASTLAGSIHYKSK